jgi:GNAT superfamily N-acetyltransferase
MHSLDFKIEALSDEQILNFWKASLWKDREDPIKPMSSMLLEGGFDMSIYEKYQARHWGLFINGELAGCNSCHASSATDMRSRGLFVDPRYRGLGFSQKLFQATEAWAKDQNCQTLWSYPKKEAMGAYLKFGFRLYENSLQTPTHCYVSKKVNSI